MHRGIHCGLPSVCTDGKPSQRSANLRQLSRRCAAHTIDMQRARAYNIMRMKALTHSALVRRQCRFGSSAVWTGECSVALAGAQS